MDSSDLLYNFMMMSLANRIDVRKLSLSAQKALHQRVIEAYKKGIKRTQIAKTFGILQVVKRSLKAQKRSRHFS